jgi:putative nucleotide binding protein
MYSQQTQQKKYEEFAFVLDFIPHGKSTVIKGREGPIIQGLGEDHLTLLEILAVPNAIFTAGEKVNIGKENRTKVVSVLGKLTYDELTNEAKNELPNVLEKLILENEKRFVQYFNELQPLTPRLHALELIPGIGKTFMREIVNEREKRPFENFDDLTNRIGVHEPAKMVARRVIEELSGGSRVTIFIKR